MNDALVVFAREVAGMVLCLSKGKGHSRFVPVFILAPPCDDSEGTPDFVAVIEPASLAIGEEFARIDDHLFDGFPSRLMLRDLIECELLPFCECRRQVRTGRHGFEGLIILLSEPRHVGRLNQGDLLSDRTIADRVGVQQTPRLT